MLGCNVPWRLSCTHAAVCDLMPGCTVSDRLLAWRRLGTEACAKHGCPENPPPPPKKKKHLLCLALSAFLPLFHPFALSLALQSLVLSFCCLHCPCPAVFALLFCHTLRSHDLPRVLQRLVTPANKPPTLRQCCQKPWFSHTGRCSLW